MMSSTSQGGPYAGFSQQEVEELSIEKIQERITERLTRTNTTFQKKCRGVLRQSEEEHDRLATKNELPQKLSKISFKDMHARLQHRRKKQIGDMEQRRKRCSLQEDPLMQHI